MVPIGWGFREGFVVGWAGCAFIWVLMGVIVGQIPRR